MNAEPLPESCENCRPFEGRWSMDADGNLKRCSCARGRALAGLPLLPVSAVRETHASDFVDEQDRRATPAPVRDGKMLSTGDNS